MGGYITMGRGGLATRYRWSDLAIGS